MTCTVSLPHVPSSEKKKELSHNSISKSLMYHHEKKRVISHKKKVNDTFCDVFYE
jgi:hypothetical protein